MKAVSLSRFIAIAAIFSMQWAFAEKHTEIFQKEGQWNVMVEEPNYLLTAQFGREPAPYYGDPTVLGGKVYKDVYSVQTEEGHSQELAVFQLVVSSEIQDLDVSGGGGLRAAAKKVLDERLKMDQQDSMKVKFDEVSEIESSNRYEWTAKVSYVHEEEGQSQLVGVIYVRLIMTHEALVLGFVDMQEPYYEGECVECLAKSFIKNIGFTSPR